MDAIAHATLERTTATVGAYVDTCRVPVTISDQQQRDLLNNTGQLEEDLRDHCIFSLAFGTGLRAIEIASLNIGDVYDERGRAKGTIILQRYKRGGKQRVRQEVFVPAAVRKKLNRLYALRRAAGEQLTPDTPVFVSRLRKRIATRTIRYLNAKWQRVAAFERRVGFHKTTRHKFGSNFYRATKDIRQTQIVMRHAALSSTIIYVHVPDEERRRNQERVLC